MTIQSWTIEEVKTGHIRAWYGLRVSIPSGWQECDGTNGSPDMRSSYPKGAGAGQEANVTGGNLTHQHATGGAHTHSSPLTTSTFAATSKLGTSTANTATVGHSHTVTIPSDGGHQHDSVNHEPPYKTCIWIWKL